MVDVILIGIDPGSGGDEGPQEGADRDLLDILQHPDDHLTPPLKQPENRGLFLF